MRILASTSEQQQCSLRNLPLNDDEGVLRGLAGLSQLQLNITPIGPLIKRLAGELGGADRLRVAAQPCHLVQRPCDTKTADTVLHQDANRLLGEVIDHRQAFDPSPSAERVEDEIHRQDLVRCARQAQAFARHRAPVAAPPPLHHQADGSV